MGSLLEVLAAPRRREILRLVWARERSAGEIHRAMPDVSFGAVSQQLRRLEGAGVIRGRRQGRFRYYRAVPESVGELRGWLEAHWGDALARLRVQAELEAARRGPRPGARPGRARGRMPQ